MSELNTIISQTTGYKKSRQATADYLLIHPELLDDFMKICFENQNPDHYKACWAMELIALKKLDYLQGQLSLICSKSKTLTNESAIRPLSKVIFLLIEAHYKTSKKEIHFSEEQRQELIEINFDWLITDTKVASKVYAMRSLQLLGKEYDWIHPELETILVKDFSTHTAAYKSVSKHILKKIK
ncbi:hypothetical protein SAMN05192550_2360 [Flavobacterium glycines]|uniref:Adenylosuccinate lyase n=1 Tax=Flavobacterium glycines TaxID=551990 RepID=A0A1B9DHG0_9FLAO|nr:hypothetical protein [Flavobacterium glycines]OCB69154.1 hypothetical protein FBGL_14075 [Flavobacterium glycines]GEL11915.1 hypothetical protein FGL01_26540 [Flavobacterium glycines]SDJ56965.1 hypothetical protein SAMN05192550_2360 [Flavobacterium glycines]